MAWQPPGKNCGACGLSSCREFTALVTSGRKEMTDCPFWHATCESETEAEYSGHDILGRDYDFIIRPLPGECSARKIILPFRPDLVEKWKISRGDILTGRPMGAGCPVQHVLRVIDANEITGVLTCSVVGPAFSRERECKDIRAYHIIGFEGLATDIRREPVFGMRQLFLPGFCMMDLAHTGVVNMILEKSSGLHIRVEDIII